MTTNFRRNKDSARRKRFLVLFLLSVACLTVVSVPPVTRTFSSLALFVAEPLWSAAGWMRGVASDVGAYFTSKAALARENDRLLKALYAVANESRRAEILSRENEQLKNALGRIVSSDDRFVLAAVLARPPTTAFDTLIIDLGEKDGLTPGMRVFSDAAFAIGEVVETYGRSSLVSLYSSSGYELDGYIGASSTPATFSGVGGGALRASVPRGAGIGVGDAIVLPSVTTDLAAVVSGIDAPEGSSLAVVHATLPVNLQQLRYVYIELPME